MKQVLYVLATLVLLSQTTHATGVNRLFDHDDEQVHFQFCAEGNHPSFDFETTGLSGPEKSLRWTEGEKREATFMIPHVYGSDNVRVTGVTFENIWAIRQLTVVVELNNIFKTAVRFSPPLLRGSITVPFPNNLTRPAVVKFRIPGACRPGEIDSGNLDPRILGIALSTMFLTLAGEVDRFSASSIVDENENPENNSNVTDEDMWKMGEIFKSIKEQYNKYLLLLQTQHYTQLSSISFLDLTQFRSAFDLHTMYTITLTDPEILKKYFQISSLMDSYGKEQALVCYRNNSAWLNFIKKKEKEIIAETKKRKAFLEECAKKKNVPTVQDEDHVINQFLLKYQEYSRDQAKQIYRKFITSI